MEHSALLPSARSSLDGSSDDGSAKPILDVKGIMHSPNCDTVLVAEVSSIQFDTYYRKATNYVIMVTFVTCIQILLLIKQMEVTNTQSVCSNDGSPALFHAHS